MPQLIRLVVSVLDGEGVAVPPSLVSISGKALAPTTTNADVGELYLTMPAGATRDLPVTVSGMKNYTIADVQSEAGEAENSGRGKPRYRLYGQDQHCDGWPEDQFALPAIANERNADEFPVDDPGVCDFKLRRGCDSEQRDRVFEFFDD